MIYFIFLSCVGCLTITAQFTSKTSGDTHPRAVLFRPVQYAVVLAPFKALLVPLKGIVHFKGPTSGPLKGAEVDKGLRYVRDFRGPTHYGPVKGGYLLYQVLLVCY